MNIFNNRLFEPGDHFPVAFDIDGIVLDTATQMWQTITKHLNLAWSVDQWVDYDIGKIVGVPTRELRHVYEPVLDRDDMPQVVGAGDALSALYHKYRKPLLFVTARRSQFKLAAKHSIDNILEGKVEYEILCTGDVCDDEYRNDKLDVLKEYKVKVFVEDNYLHWEDYIDAGIEILTLKWPWTVKPYLRMRDKGKSMWIFDSWDSLRVYIEKGADRDAFPILFDSFGGRKRRYMSDYKRNGEC